MADGNELKVETVPPSPELIELAKRVIQQNQLIVETNCNLLEMLAQNCTMLQTVGPGVTMPRAG